jgi:hypothetical protein
MPEGLPVELEKKSVSRLININTKERPMETSPAVFSSVFSFNLRWLATFLALAIRTDHANTVTIAA